MGWLIIALSTSDVLRSRSDSQICSSHIFSLTRKRQNWATRFSASQMQTPPAARTNLAVITIADRNSQQSTTYADWHVRFVTSHTYQRYFLHSWQLFFPSISKNCITDFSALLLDSNWNRLPGYFGKVILPEWTLKREGPARQKEAIGREGERAMRRLRLMSTVLNKSRHFNVQARAIRQPCKT